MFLKCMDIAKTIENFAPPSNAESWDNVGFLVGDGDAVVEKVLVALDVSNEVIVESVSLGANMIVSHHPVIFKSINRINTGNPLGKKIINLIQNNISVYSAHTNYDLADCGTSRVLAEKLGLSGIRRININETESSVFEGYTNKEINLCQFADTVKKVLGLERLKIVGNLDRKVNKVGVCAGSAADYKYMSDAAYAGCDVYLTGDVKFHDAQTAESLGLSVIDGTHYATEILAMKTLAEVLKSEFSAKQSKTEVVLSSWDGKMFIEY